MCLAVIKSAHLYLYSLAFHRRRTRSVKRPSRSSAPHCNAVTSHSFGLLKCGESENPANNRAGSGPWRGVVAQSIFLFFEEEQEEHFSGESILDSPFSQSWHDSLRTADSHTAPPHSSSWAPWLARPTSAMLICLGTGHALTGCYSTLFRPQTLPTFPTAGSIPRSSTRRPCCPQSPQPESLIYRRHVCCVFVWP